MDIKDTVGKLKGVGEKTEKLYAKLGIYTISDLLEYYPRTYDVVEDAVTADKVTEDSVCAVAGVITKRPVMAPSSKLQILSATLNENGASLKLVWFRMPFLRNKLSVGSRFIFRGRVVRKREGLVMEQPKIYTFAEYDRIKGTMQPVYALTKGITSQSIAKMMKQALEILNLQKDRLPRQVREKYSLAEYNYAIQCIHFPIKKEDLIYARKRLVFDEFFSFLLKIRSMKDNEELKENHFDLSKNEKTKALCDSLPYKLTNAQQKVYKEIENDMLSGHVMNRLVQGDVGSGKTILALLALVRVMENGYQGALMAPTEVLAKQHYESVIQMFEAAGLDFRCCLLTGSLSAKEKRNIHDRIMLGQFDLIIGTHALIQNGVSYKNLALVITDEQHRFGVNQRKNFFEKGENPHVLVMSATPIPRTLAIMIYGDMDLSVIDELPANRLPIKNCVVDVSYRKTAYSFMLKQINEGRQVYIICPMVEESECFEGENVIDYTQNLRNYFPPEIKIEYLHGKMKQNQKDEIMEAYARNDIQILVSTTVIEVGINVPNATVMLIENAERFGLAQLHQLRGRVGRGKHQSYCIFMMGNKNSKNSERLEILNKSNDGFFVASEDLKLRGPGDFFGIRQSGILDFKIADIYQDAAVLSMASEMADSIKGTDEEEIYIKQFDKTVIL